MSQRHAPRDHNRTIQRAHDHASSDDPTQVPRRAAESAAGVREAASSRQKAIASLHAARGSVVSCSLESRMLLALLVFSNSIRRKFETIFPRDWLAISDGSKKN